jgi:hypothetical protein
MVHQSYFTAFNADFGSGTKWVLQRLQHAAKAAGLDIGAGRWSPDIAAPEEEDAEERLVLTFSCGSIEFWEPFEVTDLEDAAASASVRAQLERQVKRILARVEHSVRQPEPPPALAPFFQP